MPMTSKDQVTGQEFIARSFKASARGDNLVALGTGVLLEQQLAVEGENGSVLAPAKEYSACYVVDARALADFRDVIN